MGLIQEFQQAGAERRREVKQVQSEVKQCQHEVDTMLKEFNEAHSVMSSELRNSLTQGVTKCRSEVTTMVQDFVEQAQQRKAGVAAIAQEAAAIVEAADTFVKDLARGSVQRRSEVASIHEMVWGKAPTVRKVVPVVKESPRDAVIEMAPAGELRDKVFTYLAKHPDGTRLTELEEEFGMARIQTARVVRELMDNNKVEKRDLLYFII